MELKPEDVRHVARLARLALSDEEVEGFRTQLSAILDYAEAVGEVAADDVPPTTHPLGLSNVFREDEPAPSYDQARALSTAPQPEDGRFRVPAIRSADADGEAG